MHDHAVQRNQVSVVTEVSDFRGDLEQYAKGMLPQNAKGRKWGDVGYGLHRPVKSRTNLKILTRIYMPNQT